LYPDDDGTATQEPTASLPEGTLSARQLAGLRKASRLRGYWPQLPPLARGTPTAGRADRGERERDRAGRRVEPTETEKSQSRQYLNPRDRLDRLGGSCCVGVLRTSNACGRRTTRHYFRPRGGCWPPPLPAEWRHPELNASAQALAGAESAKKHGGLGQEWRLVRRPRGPAPAGGVSRPGRAAHERRRSVYLDVARPSSVDRGWVPRCGSEENESEETDTGIAGRARARGSRCLRVAWRGSGRARPSGRAGGWPGASGDAAATAGRPAGGADDPG
jgi:hypothetical protein